MWTIQYLYGGPERLKYELIPTTVKISTNNKLLPNNQIQPRLMGTH
jgi:hypothetical protein